MFTFQMTVAGLQRKEVAGLIGSYFGTKPVYQGAPSFEYSLADNSIRSTLPLDDKKA